MVPEILDERKADQIVARILKRERYRKLKEGIKPMSELKLFIGDKSDGSKSVFAIQQAAPITREDIEQLIIDSEAQTETFKKALANYDTLSTSLPAPAAETENDSDADDEATPAAPADSTTAPAETATAPVAEAAPTTQAPATDAAQTTETPAAPVADAPAAAPVQ